MVNHVRTWLANISPTQGVVPGEELIVDTFHPVSESKMSNDLKFVRRALFGGTPSRNTVLVRTAVFLQVLHSSVFREDLLATDPRITYEPDGSQVFSSGIAEEYNLTDTIADLAFIDNPGGTFFTGYNQYRDTWQQSQDQFDRLASVLLVAALRTERAAIGTE